VDPDSIVTKIILSLSDMSLGHCVQSFPHHRKIIPESVRSSLGRGAGP